MGGFVLASNQSLGIVRKWEGSQLISISTCNEGPLKCFLIPFAEGAREESYCHRQHSFAWTFSRFIHFLGSTIVLSPAHHDKDWLVQFHPTPINSVKQPVGREEKPEINSSCFIGLTGYFRLFRSICWLVCSVAAVPAKCHRGTSGQGRPYQKVNTRLTVGSGCFFGWADLAVICSHEHHHGQIASGEWWITITATFVERLLCGPFTDIITWLSTNQQGRNCHPSLLFSCMRFLERSFTWLASSKRKRQPSNPPLSIVKADILGRIPLASYLWIAWWLRTDSGTWQRWVQILALPGGPCETYITFLNFCFSIRDRFYLGGLQEHCLWWLQPQN